eukprot:764585-Hanusia_phi.AAC.3
MKELVEQHEKLGKKINKKVMGMFEKAEQEYQDVMEKKRIVENDKRKIEVPVPPARQPSFTLAASDGDGGAR